MKRIQLERFGMLAGVGLIAACSGGDFSDGSTMQGAEQAPTDSSTQSCDPATTDDCVQDAWGRWWKRKSPSPSPSPTDSGIADSGSSVPQGNDASLPQVEDAGGAPPVVDSGAPSTPTLQPTLLQDFNAWSGNLSPDGIWRIAGTWVGTGGNTLVPSNATFIANAAGAPGSVLQLLSEPNVLRGSEIQTIQTYGYGYYETRMKVAATPGICDSFFWMEGTVKNGNTSGYGPHEWDVEFLTNESWINSANSGKVHYTLHYQDGSWDAFILDLPFNPSKDFHSYGFLWKPGTITFTVDGKATHTFNSAKITTTAKGFIMMNSWTGNPNWGGGPPTAAATTQYDWAKFYDGVAAIP